MHPMLVWGVAYLLPAIIAGIGRYLFGKAKKQLSWQLVLFIHIALLCSAAISQFYLHAQGFDFATFSWITVALYLFAMVLCWVILKWYGVAYTLSALVQQFTILSIAAYLLHFYSVILTMLLVVSIFAVGHLHTLKKWKAKFLLTAVWGVLAILLYLSFHDVLLVAAIHAVLGSLCIRKGIFYIK
jgi:hypothetical protein